MEKNKYLKKIRQLSLEIEDLKKINHALMERFEKDAQDENHSGELERLTLQISQERNKIYKVLQSLPGLIVMFNSRFEVIDFFEGRGDTNITPSKHKNIKEVFNADFFDELVKAHAELTKKAGVIYFDFSNGENVSEKMYRCTLSEVNEDQYVLYIQDDTEKVMKDRTIQAQKAQIVQASKLSSLGEMAGGIAHEMNTPLGTINLLAGQIETRLADLNPDLIQVLYMAQKIQHTVRRISVTVKSLRQISRDGSNDLLEECELTELVNEALDLCRERFRLNGIQLNVSIPENITVMAKRVQLTQVILNLLNNSFYVAKFHAEPWINIKCVDMEDRVRIHLVDCGHGIEPKILERVFDPFFTTKELGEGTGLGMSISQQIIKEHGSMITYELHDGHTSFFFDLKKVKESQVAA